MSFERKYRYKKILIIGDNADILEMVYDVLSQKGLDRAVCIQYACSPASNIKTDMLGTLKQLNMKDELERVCESYDLIISAHCRQIFPSGLVEKVKCINIHPGYNPYNRGWYPHVFSIINKLPTGATMHEMDGSIDHGPIIAQREEPILPEDTSETLYGRILTLEKELFAEYIERILLDDYHAYLPETEGNINTKKDFERLRHIALDRSYTAGELIDLLRALTHGTYRNAFYSDENNQKIYINITLERDKHDEEV